MLANIVEKWCLRGWYKNQKIPDLCGGAEQLPFIYHVDSTIPVSGTGLQQSPQSIVTTQAGPESV
ncbi:hypothetical protein [Endozoicomonas sp. SCSIO W0465]|uniref:hypothetical protein n=1 Tax=Endozoicomonas sp. SCSIO W0465 TaxID=2918516 RepID=UPI00207542F9|nr:hypothetical protein [Endozoicomonas sp. SCSIO W0465]USE35506.1 hypothetical protein MJO57_26000 [Endozoicomonas sp. SCSIO W0465]